MSQKTLHLGLFVLAGTYGDPFNGDFWHALGSGEYTPDGSTIEWSVRKNSSEDAGFGSNMSGIIPDGFTGTVTFDVEVDVTTGFSALDVQLRLHHYAGATPTLVSSGSYSAAQSFTAGTKTYQVSINITTAWNPALYHFLALEFFGDNTDTKNNADVVITVGASYDDDVLVTWPSYISASPQIEVDADLVAPDLTPNGTWPDFLATPLMRDSSGQLWFVTIDDPVARIFKCADPDTSTYWDQIATIDISPAGVNDVACTLKDDYIYIAIYGNNGAVYTVQSKCFDTTTEVLVSAFTSSGQATSSSLESLRIEKEGTHSSGSLWINWGEGTGAYICEVTNAGAWTERFGAGLSSTEPSEQMKVLSSYICLISHTDVGVTLYVHYIDRTSWTETVYGSYTGSWNSTSRVVSAIRDMGSTVEFIYRDWSSTPSPNSNMRVFSHAIGSSGTPTIIDGYNIPGLVGDVGGLYNSTYDNEWGMWWIYSSQYNWLREQDTTPTTSFASATGIRLLLRTNAEDVWYFDQTNGLQLETGIWGPSDYPDVGVLPSLVGEMGGSANRRGPVLYSGKLYAVTSAVEDATNVRYRLWECANPSADGSWLVKASKLISSETHDPNNHASCLVGTSTLVVVCHNTASGFWRSFAWDLSDFSEDTSWADASTTHGYSNVCVVPYGSAAVIVTGIASGTIGIWQCSDTIGFGTIITTVGGGSAEGIWAAWGDGTNAHLVYCSTSFGNIYSYSWASWASQNVQSCTNLPDDPDVTSLALIEYDSANSEVVIGYCGRDGTDNDYFLGIVRFDLRGTGSKGYDTHYDTGSSLVNLTATGGFIHPSDSKANFLFRWATGTIDRLIEGEAAPEGDTSSGTTSAPGSTYIDLDTYHTVFK